MSVAGLIFYRIGLCVQFVLGYGLPDDYTDKENSFWRVMVAFPIIIALIH